MKLVSFPKKGVPLPSIKGAHPISYGKESKGFKLYPQKRMKA